jgi:actin related protein 2/3 complex subunit 1A/1B
MVGYYYKEDNCWETEKLRRFKSTAISCAFHPSGRVLGVGSMNSRFYLISSYLADHEYIEDAKYTGIFSGVKTFGDILYDVSLDGWVESIAWSPNGLECTAAAHNSTLSTLYWAKDQFDRIETTKLKSFPLSKILYKNDNELVAGGYDNIPLSFKKNGKTGYPIIQLIILGIKAAGLKKTTRVVRCRSSET